MGARVPESAHVRQGDSFDYLSRFHGRQYNPGALLASARRMEAAGLGRYLSVAEKRLIADNDNLPPTSAEWEGV